MIGMTEVVEKSEAQAKVTETSYSVYLYLFKVF